MRGLQNQVGAYAFPSSKEEYNGADYGRKISVSN